MNSGVKPHKQKVFIAKSTKKQFLLTNSVVITSILRVSGPELHFSSTESINFFGTQSSLGGYNSRLGGGTSSDLRGHDPEILPPPRGAEPELRPSSRLAFRSISYSSIQFIIIIYRANELSRRVSTRDEHFRIVSYSRNIPNS